MYPESLKNLIESFKILPGIGEKTAERLAFYLINEDKENKIEEVVAEDDLSDGYTEDVSDDKLLDEEEIEDSDELFEDLDDEGEDEIFDEDE